MSKKYYCDWCSAELGEIACSNNYGGIYCSVQCADADEEVESQPVTVTANDVRWNPDKVIDMFAALAQKVTELERQNEELEAVRQQEHVQVRNLINELANANERAIKRVADRVEENGNNIVTLSQELETETHNLDDKIEMALGDIVTLDERTSHLTQQTSRVDLVSEFIMNDIVILSEKIGRLRGEK
jgi:ribosome-binding ATPase YchF (GTP1/OBG family)